MKEQFRGLLTEKEEFVYPDSELAVLPETLRIVMPLNGQPGVQLLLETDAKEVSMILEGEGFQAEWFLMKEIPVEYNTGDGENQGGAMVLMDVPEEKPVYVTRKAPFWVYDCLIQKENGVIETKNGKAAVYFCLKADQGITPGTHTVVVKANMGEGTYSCTITVEVYNVTIPENTFSVTNWFSEEAICKCHNVEQGTAEYMKVLREYVRAMRRMHQNVFFIQLNEECVHSKKPYTFDFEYLTPIISCFFEEGMQYMEMGVLLDRGFLPDGMPDMYTKNFTCSMAKDVQVDSLEGYAITVCFIQSLASYLKAHGWEKKVLFHIHDEPDIHFKDEETLRERRRQYYLAASILRKYIPGVQVIEAVDSAQFRGGIDIWVPGTAGYEKKKDEFDQLIELGETVWTYVCCGPEGHWLNRFLDFALLKGRLLYWGCAKNRISGFLHWGLNQFQMGMDPYKGTSCPNHTGIGTNFPCGDSFLVYPGDGGPNIGMRMEAQRRGTEDVALCQMLREKDSNLHDQIVGKVFTNNYTYADDLDTFQEVYEELLKALE